MGDLLVRLYDRPAFRAAETDQLVRRAFAAEKEIVARWVSEHFSRGWASECEAAFARLPVSCFLAMEDEKILAFACYDATARGFFGPFGVAEEFRGRGLGCALLQAALRDMAANGYAYAVIGAAAEPGFYQKAVGAIPIPESDPGFYRGLLKG